MMNYVVKRNKNNNLAVNLIKKQNVKYTLIIMNQVLSHADT